MSDQQREVPLIVDSWKEPNPLGAFSKEPRQGVPLVEAPIPAPRLPALESRTDTGSSRGHSRSLVLGLAGLAAIAVVALTLIVSRDTQQEAAGTKLVQSVIPPTIEVPVGSTGPLAQSERSTLIANVPDPIDEPDTVAGVSEQGPERPSAEGPGSTGPARPLRTESVLQAAETAVPRMEAVRTPAAVLADTPAVETASAPMPAVVPASAPRSPRVAESAGPPAASNPGVANPPSSNPAPAVSMNARTAVESVLQRYASAFSALDARAAKSVWPSVNEGGLARAFASLQEQQIDLGACDIWVTGPTAVASCEGRARYTPRIGNKDPRSEPRAWTFYLEQDGEGWSIANVAMR